MVVVAAMIITTTLIQPLQTNEKGQVTAKRGLLKGQIDVLKEETGLTCCICREGYKNQPNKVCINTVIFYRSFNIFIYI